MCPRTDQLMSDQADNSKMGSVGPPIGAEGADSSRRSLRDPTCKERKKKGDLCMTRRGIKSGSFMCSRAAQHRIIAASV